MTFDACNTSDDTLKEEQLRSANKFQNDGIRKDTCQTRNIKENPMIVRAISKRRLPTFSAIHGIFLEDQTLL